MAEAQMNVFGGVAAVASAFDRFCVLATRLSRMRFFFASVQRPATLSPERWMIVSKPETRSGGTVCIGSHRTSFAPPVSRRTRRVTLHPCDSSEETRADPISPEAPLMRMRSNAANVADFEADRLAARKVLGAQRF